MSVTFFTYVITQVMTYVRNVTYALVQLSVSMTEAQQNVRNVFIHNNKRSKDEILQRAQTVTSSARVSVSAGLYRAEGEEVNRTVE